MYMAGRILLVDRDFKIVKDTYHVDEGRTLVSPKVISVSEWDGFRRFKEDRADDRTGCSGKKPGVSQVQGAMLVKYFQQ